MITLCVVFVVSVVLGIALGKLASYSQNTDEYEDQWTRLPHPD